MPLPCGELRPHIILECTSDDDALAFDLLMRQLSRSGRRVPDKLSEVIASSSADESGSPEVLAGLDIDQIAGFVRQHQVPPAWASASAGYVHVRHDLTLALRRGRLVVVRTEVDINGRLQKWLNEPGRPYRRIEPEVLECALLQGEAKGLWLQDARRPNINRVGSKTLAGPYLQNALDPMDDASYAMGAGKADLPDDGSLTT